MSCLLKLDTALLLARGNMPYMAMVLHSLQPREFPGVCTMAVTRDAVLLYEPAYVEQHDHAWLAADLLHECMHLLFRHSDRAVMQGTLAGAKLWNAASDACVNENLRNAEKAIVVLVGGRKFHIGEDAIFPESLEQPENIIEEERYRLLKEKQEKQGDGSCELQQQGGVGQGQCGSCAGNAVDGEPKNEGRSEAEVVRIRTAVAEEVQKHIKSRGIGSVPAGLAVWAKATLTPPEIDWRTQLSRFVRAAVAYKAGAVDIGWNRPSRRQAGLGYGAGVPIMPALRAPIPNVACVVDTSGSMGSEQLVAALSEVDGVLKALGSDITIVACDSDVHGVKKVSTAAQAAAMLKGGGGTDMQPAIEVVSKLKPRVGVCVIATDGYIPPVTMPEPGFRVVWVVIGGATELPCSWGERVFIKPEQMS